MMMTDWYEQSMRALQLSGKGVRTQQMYTRSVRKLVEFYEKTPDAITETELQDYFLHRINIDEWSPGTMRICHAGIRFFFANVLDRSWRTFKYLQPADGAQPGGGAARSSLRLHPSQPRLSHHRLRLRRKRQP